MATVGTLVINLALNSVGITAGLATVEGQLAALRAQIMGVAQGEVVGSGAAASLTAAQNTLTLATNRVAVAQARLIELEGAETVTTSSLLAARGRLTAATMGMATAQNRLVAAQITAAAPSRGGFPAITLAATIATAAVAMFGDESVRAAAKFQYEMKLIQTQANAGRDEVARMTDEIYKLAPSVQAGPQELAEGLFHIESVGLRGAQALDILKTAAQGAAVGNADLESVTNALIATVLSGISDVQGMSHGIEDMGRAMGTLNGIVGSGNVRMQDLASSLSSGVLSTARQFGISIQQVGAALATMTDQGIPAEEAATRLRITIALIGAPTKIAAEQLGHIGLTQRSLADQMRGPNGLVGALRLLKDHMDAAGLDAVEQSQLLKTAFGGSRSSAGILTLINSLGLMDTKLEVIGEKSGSFAEDFIAESETAKAHFDDFSATLEVLKIRIGNGLLVVIKPLVDVLAAVIKHTAIITPLFLLLSIAITGLVVKSLAQLTIGFYRWLFDTVKQMVANEALVASTEEVVVAEAELVAATAETAIATETATASTTTLVAGLAGVDGAIEATVGSTAQLVAGLAGADGAIEATVGATGTLVAGLAGADGAILATAASTGSLVAGLAGVDGAIAATVGGTGALVAGLAGADGAMEAAFVASGPLVTGLTTATAATDALAVSSGTALVGGLSAASVAMGRTAVAAEGLAVAESAVGTTATVAGAAGATAFAAMLPPLLLLIVAAELLITNFDKVKNGLSVISLSEIDQNIHMIETSPWLDQAEKEKRLKEQYALRDQEIRNMQENQSKIDGASPEAMAAKAKEAAAAALEDIKDLTATLMEKYGDSLAGVEQAFADAGAADMAAYAKALRDEADAPVQALVELRDVMADSLSSTDEIAQLYGEFTSADLAAGLASNIPAVRAAAYAMQLAVTERLDALTNDAFSAGLRYQEALKLFSEMPYDAADPEAKRAAALNLQLLASQARPWEKVKPSVDATTAAMKRLNAQLQEAEDSKIASALSRAFSDIQSVAMKYFSAIHDARLKAISDARDEKNAILDAKAALNQAPVTAMQTALDFQRRQIQEWRLRQAVSTAQDPEQYRDAVLALQDFLAQVHIDEMQSEVDKANDVIDARKDRNGEIADQQRDAEDRRYDLSVAAFQRDMELLQQSLIDQHATWQEGEAAILGLLGDYGIDYALVGTTLGETFSLNLRDAVRAGIEAMKTEYDKAIAGYFMGVPIPDTYTGGPGSFTSAIPPYNSNGDVSVGGTSAPTSAYTPPPDYSGKISGLPSYATGNWQIMKDHLAMIHKDEMVVPSDAASILRDVTGQGTFRSGFGRSVAAAAREPGGIGQRSGGGTLVLKVGDDKWAELTDQELSVQDSIYGTRELSLGSRR